MTYEIVFLILLSMISDILSQCSNNDVYRNMLEKKTLNFTQIAGRVGYAVEEYDVITQDSYILKLFHIPGDKTKPVLLMHGIIDCADTFIVRGNTSLAVTLARAGYDVWIGNTRGNRYARRHVYLNPDEDVEFWDFSFHEHGFYDLPAIIDFVLDRTGEKRLSAIGHSQGNTIFLVLGATRPEYNEKVNLLIALSPMCFLNNLQNVASLMVHSMPVLEQIYTIAGQEEFLGDDTIVSRMFRAFCGCKRSYGVCAYGIFFPIAGSDPDEMESDFFPTIVAHYPTGTSKKNAVHISQIGMKKKFLSYDYEFRNVDVYNSSTPPEYDLSKVTMKVALFAGKNDQISTIRDVKLLRSRLPNVVEFKIVDHKRFNHIDAVWGRNVHKYLFPDILEVLETYR
ncbi:lipase 1-like [Maniola hyperantus]|uniref:lipase 1-like n=1 Tax=Aphantopus hyperantus TaxID=2795564 RepID=UPI00156937D1|nr:lipase 1-like [Maniola hyperantus]